MLLRLKPAARRGFSSSSTRGALNAVASSKAEAISAAWEGTSATGGNTKNFIAGAF